MRDENCGSYRGGDSGPAATPGNLYGAYDACKAAEPLRTESQVVRDLRAKREEIRRLQEQQNQQLYIIDQLLSVFTI